MTVCLFVDEFTNYNDTETGIAAIKLLTSLNYRVITPNHSVSARTFLSKGLVRKARKNIQKNIEVLSVNNHDEIPLIGIEPSAILGFRDEYPELAGSELKRSANKTSSKQFS